MSDDTIEMPESQYNAARRAAVKAILRAIDDYSGEPMTADVHPLWLAVVVLECLEHRNERSSVQPYRLPPGLHSAWLCGLWASRGTRLVPYMQTISESPRGSGNPDPELAKKWIGHLARLLKKRYL